MEKWIVLFKYFGEPKDDGLFHAIVFGTEEQARAWTEDHMVEDVLIYRGSKAASVSAVESAPARIECQDVPVTAARRCGGSCRCGNDGSCGCH